MSSLFPYEFREKQKEVLEFISKNLDKNICIDAPTGFGKTSVILSSFLSEKTNNDVKILWAVKTGNETDRPIEELKVINEKTKNGLFGLSFRGKKDMCLLVKTMRFEKPKSDDVIYLCENMKKECKFHENLMKLGKDEIELLTKKSMLYSEIVEYSKERHICPYYLQMELLKHANVVSLNYNYVINETMGAGIKSVFGQSKAHLVADEAHNLQFIASNVNSAKISSLSLMFAFKEMDKFNDRNADLVKSFIIKLNTILKDFNDTIYEEDQFDVEYILNKTGYGDKITGVLDIMLNYGSAVRKDQLKNKKPPHSSLFRLANFWIDCLKNLNKEGIVFLATKIDNNLFLEMLDMRSAETLKDLWNEYKSCIFCSGTLSPVDAFAETIGLENYVEQKIRFQYNKSNILTLFTKGLTTRGVLMGKPMIDAYLKSLDDFMKIVDGNVAIFSSSYRIQFDLMKNGLEKIAMKNDRVFFAERKDMDGHEARKTLNDFKKCAHQGNKGILCATMSGRFAEGADFPGKELVGAFLVGIPFDRMNIRTKLYLEYYKKLYGPSKGTYYAYIIPAIRRASQALGRVLRSKDDKAIFVCGDERYLEGRLFHLLPDYVKVNYKAVPHTLLSNALQAHLKNSL